METGRARAEESAMGRGRRNWLSVIPLTLSCLLTLALPAAAELNQNCVVSILNRTAQVRSDGTWILANVPTNFGRVRARATCVEGGITRSGQSELFMIP